MRSKWYEKPMLQFYEYLLSVGQASFAVLKKVVRPLLFLLLLLLLKTLKKFSLSAKCYTLCMQHKKRMTFFIGQSFFQQWRKIHNRVYWISNMKLFFSKLFLHFFKKKVTFLGIFLFSKNFLFSSKQSVADCIQICFDKGVCIFTIWLLLCSVSVHTVVIFSATHWFLAWRRGKKGPDEKGHFSALNSFFCLPKLSTSGGPTLLGKTWFYPHL